MNRLSKNHSTNWRLVFLAMLVPLAACHPPVRHHYRGRSHYCGSHHHFSEHGPETQQWMTNSDQLKALQCTAKSAC